jgi:hypothetical protein
MFDFVFRLEEDEDEEYDDMDDYEDEDDAEDDEDEDKDEDGIPDKKDENYDVDEALPYQEVLLAQALKNLGPDGREYIAAALRLAVSMGASANTITNKCCMCNRISVEAQCGSLTQIPVPHSGGMKKPQVPEPARKNLKPAEMKKAAEKGLHKKQGAKMEDGKE